MASDGGLVGLEAGDRAVDREAHRARGDAIDEGRGHVAERGRRHDRICTRVVHDQLGFFGGEVPVTAHKYMPERTAAQ